MNEKIVGIEMIVPCKHRIKNFEALRSDPVLTILKKLPKMIDRGGITLSADRSIAPAFLRCSALYDRFQTRFSLMLIETES